jgi:hypothetical protein
MNERIRELILEAGFPKFDKMYVVSDGKELEKFAELIVREFVSTLVDNTPERYTNDSAEEDWDKGYDRAMRDCIHHIQEHFGIKE